MNVTKNLAKAIRTLAKEYEGMSPNDIRATAYVTSDIVYNNESGDLCENLFSYTCRYLAGVLMEAALEIDNLPPVDSRYQTIFEAALTVLTKPEENDRLFLFIPTGNKTIQIRGFNTLDGWVIYSLQNGAVDELHEAVTQYCKAGNFTMEQCFSAKNTMFS